MENIAQMLSILGARFFSFSMHFKGKAIQTRELKKKKQKIAKNEKMLQRCNMSSSGPGPIHRLVWLENYPAQCWVRTIPLKRDRSLQSVSKKHQVRILKKQRILVVLDSRRRRIRDGEQTIPAPLLLLLLLLTLLLLLMLHVP